MIEFVGPASRLLHLVLLIALVGVSWILLVAGPSDRPTSRAWQARMVAWTRGLAVLALLSGFVVLAYQTAYLAGRPLAAVDPATIAKVLLETRAGSVWLVRESLLLLAVAFLSVGAHAEGSADWLAARGEAALLTVM